ncbi:MAG TPA: hypothetical protein VHT27_14850 [Solirubrobacteraceae bacterium]|jgi:hypothetical protein|nr:hypothetical protein [Solirubrobacteraceae bacterium]
MSQADYVEFGGRATAPPPFLSTEGTFRGLLLRGDATKIAELVERVYNVPAEGKVVYRPMFGEWLLMQSGAFKKVSSQAPGFADWGSVDEAQTSVWIPVAAGRIEDKKFIAERVAMCVPYILVNNPMSYAGGREIYGYPKTLGIFEPASALGSPQVVQAFGGDFKATNEAGWRTLLELKLTGRDTPQPGAWRDLGDVLETLPRVWHELADGLPEVSVLKSILEALSGHQTLQVFLKQFRDAAVAGKACYQGVVESPIRFLKTQMRPSLAEWKVVVNHLDSHPIDTELGLTTQTTRLSFEGQMDFVAEPGKIVAPANPSP